MGDIKQRVSYIKGLADGLGVQDDSKESKVLLEILNVMELMAVELERNAMETKELSDYVDDMSDDMDELENSLYELDEADEEFNMLDDDDLGDFEQLECPNCGDVIYFDPAFVETHEDLLCPTCHKSVVVNTDELSF